jgi:carboxyl-terminal processing protease
MQEKRRPQKWLWVISLILVTNAMTFVLTAMGVWHLPKRYVISASSRRTAHDAQKFATLESAIQDRYYQNITLNKVSTSAYRAMFKAVGDRYSEYYSKSQMKEMNQSISGTYVGIGIAVTEDSARNAIIATVFKNSPAANADLKIGDKILSVNGHSMAGKGTAAVVSKIKGKSGTKVMVGIERNGEKKDLTLVRRAITTPTVSSRVISRNNRKIGYIAIAEFTEKTSREFNTQLKALRTQQIDGLVIDLRWNGGGIVDSAVKVADNIVGRGEVVYTVDKNGHREDYRATSQEHFDQPVALLVNGYSASASEILAGALQDTKKASLVGSKTFGKGIVQEVVPLLDGSGYKLTIAQYFTPKGRNIHKKGLTPDYVVKQSKAYQNVVIVPERQDLQLQKALEVVAR